MPELSTASSFSLTAIALIAIPGPNLIYITTRSISEGRRSGIASALGVETGTLAHVAAAAVGLSALVAGALGSWLRARPRAARRQRYFTGTVYLALGAAAALSGERRTGR